MWRYSFPFRWAFLELHTNSSKTNEAQAYAAGYLEGSITADAIYMHWFNTLSDFCEGRTDLCADLNQYLAENIKFIKKKISLLCHNDEFWHHVSTNLKRASIA